MNNENITVFYEGEISSDMPIAVIHTFQNEGDKVFEEYRKLGGRSIVLIAVQADRWNDTLSPWKAKAVFKGSGDFGCGADEHIAELEKLIRDIRQQTGCTDSKCAIAGYSFAGLFALYSVFKTDIFSSAVSASGSLWFCGFREFVLQNDPVGEIDKIYLSLGDKESKTKNHEMSMVEQNTKDIYDCFVSKGIDCTFEMNSGGHFNDTEKRLAKGIFDVFGL